MRLSSLLMSYATVKKTNEYLFHPRFRNTFVLLVLNVSYTVSAHREPCSVMSNISFHKVCTFSIISDDSLIKMYVRMCVDTVYITLVVPLTVRLVAWRRSEPVGRDYYGGCLRRLTQANDLTRVVERNTKIRM